MAGLDVLLIRRWSIRPWTHGENARLRDLESIGVCTLGLGQSRVMQWRASVSAALLLLLGASGGFCYAHRRRSRRASRRERERVFKILAGTLLLPGFLCAGNPIYC